MDRTIAETRRMKPALAWLLGVAIAAQFAHLALILGVVGVAAVQGGGNPVGHLAIGIGELIVHYVVAVVLVTIALPLLVLHAQRSDRLDDRERRRWLINLALWGPVTMPVYWWRFLRP